MKEHSEMHEIQLEINKEFLIVMKRIEKDIEKILNVIVEITEDINQY